jgi:hypothetical protein
MARKPLLSLRSAICGVLLLWLIYTILYTLHPSDALAAFLEFVPGVLAIAVLMAAGFQRQECYLRFGMISRTGLALLGASFLFMPFIWMTGRWTGWNWQAAILFAPASGIAQELFFRAALLAVLLVKFKAKPSLAFLIHSLLFTLWHIPRASLTAPLGGVIGVAVVTFINGWLWGKQVQRDRTIVWLVGFHSMLLVINSFITWG